MSDINAKFCRIFAIFCLLALGCSLRSTMAAESAEQTVTWDQANCRTQSTIYPMARGWAYINSYGTHSATGLERDLELKHCLESQRSIVLRSVLQDTGTTQFEDRGMTEFFPPGNRQDLSRCSYFVKKGEKVSVRLQQYLKGEVRFNGGDDDELQRFIDQVREFNREMEEIVFIECAIS